MESVYLNDQWQTVRKPKSKEIIQFQRVMLFLLTISTASVLFWAVLLKEENKNLKSKNNNYGTVHSK